MSYQILNAVLRDSGVFKKIKNIRVKDEHELAGRTQEIIYNHFDYFNISNGSNDLGDKELVYQLENTDYLLVANVIKQFC